MRGCWRPDLSRDLLGLQLIVSDQEPIQATAGSRQQLWSANNGEPWLSFQAFLRYHSALRGTGEPDLHAVPATLLSAAKTAVDPDGANQISTVQTS